MGTIVAPERQLFYEEDVQAGAAVSESLLAKNASNQNFIFYNITQTLAFGITGAPFSSLAFPYTGRGIETIIENYLVQRLTISLETTGTSGQTEFRLERKLAGSGTWTNMFSTNCVILSSAADNMITTTGETAPTGVTHPVLSITNLAKGDQVRLVAISAASGAYNLKAHLKVSPL